MMTPTFHICPVCHQRIPVESGQTLDEVALDHLANCPGWPSPWSAEAKNNPISYSLPAQRRGHKPPLTHPL